MWVILFAFARAYAHGNQCRSASQTCAARNTGLVLVGALVQSTVLPFAFEMILTRGSLTKMIVTIFSSQIPGFLFKYQHVQNCRFTVMRQ